MKAEQEVQKGFGRGFGGCFGVLAAIFVIIIVLSAIGEHSEAINNQGERGIGIILGLAFWGFIIYSIIKYIKNKNNSKPNLLNTSEYICSNCKSDIKETDKFCQNCGEKLD